MQKSNPFLEFDFSASESDSDDLIANNSGTRPNLIEVLET